MVKENKNMENLEKLVHIKHVEDEHFNIMYVSDVDSNPSTSIKKMTLDNDLNKNDLLKELVEKIEYLTTFSDKEDNKFFKYSDNKTNELKEIITSLYDENSEMSHIIIPHFLAKDLSLDILEGELVEIDDIFNINCKTYVSKYTENILLYKKNLSDEPGLVFIKNDDKYNICEIGFFPHTKFRKINIKKV